MNKSYRVTPKNGKWIIQKLDDRSTVKIDGSPFKLKTDAEAACWKLHNPGAADIKTGITFVDAFFKFAEMKAALKNNNNRVTSHSLQRYMTTYKLRIVPYMDKQVLLSEFKLGDMEAFLKKAYDDGTCFKTLRNVVKDIKHFIKQANLRGWSPCRDMETFKIYDYAYVIPNDDALIARKPTNVLSQEMCFKLITNAYLDWKNSNN